MHSDHLYDEVMEYKSYHLSKQSQLREGGGGKDILMNLV